MAQRIVGRALAVLVGTVALLAPALPALAQQRDAGDEPGAPMSVPAVIVVFIGVPLLISAVTYALVYLPAWRQRTGALMRTGTAPTWFNGPSVQAAEAAAPVGDLARRGGASATW